MKKLLLLIVLFLPFIVKANVLIPTQTKIYFYEDHVRFHEPSVDALFKKHLIMSKVHLYAILRNVTES